MVVVGQCGELDGGSLGSAVTRFGLCMSSYLRLIAASSDLNRSGLRATDCNRVRFRPTQAANRRPAELHWLNCQPRWRNCKVRSVGTEATRSCNAVPFDGASVRIDGARGWPTRQAARARALGGPSADLCSRCRRKKRWSAVRGKAERYGLASCTTLHNAHPKERRTTKRDNAEELARSSRCETLWPRSSAAW